MKPLSSAVRSALANQIAELTEGEEELFAPGPITMGETPLPLWTLCRPEEAGNLPLDQLATHKRSSVVPLYSSGRGVGYAILDWSPDETVHVSEITASPLGEALLVRLQELGATEPLGVLFVPEIQTWLLWMQAKHFLRVVAAPPEAKLPLGKTLTEAEFIHHFLNAPSLSGMVGSVTAHAI